MYNLLFYLFTFLLLFDGAKVRRKLPPHNPIRMSFHIPNVWYIAKNHCKSWSVMAQTQESDHTFSAVSTMSMMV